MSFSPSALSVSRSQPSSSSSVSSADASSASAFRSALTPQIVAEYAIKLEKIEQKLAAEAEIDDNDLDPAQSRQRNAARGWKFHSRREEIDIFTRRDGDANFCKGQTERAQESKTCHFQLLSWLLFSDGSIFVSVFLSVSFYHLLNHSFHAINYLPLSLFHLFHSFDSSYFIFCPIISSVSTLSAYRLIILTPINHLTLISFPHSAISDRRGHHPGASFRGQVRLHRQRQSTRVGRFF